MPGKLLLRATAGEHFVESEDYYYLLWAPDSMRALRWSETWATKWSSRPIFSTQLHSYVIQVNPRFGGVIWSSNGPG